MTINVRATNRTIWRSLCLVVIVALGTTASVFAQTPDASPTSDTALPDGPLGDQIGWVIDAANGEVSLTNPAEIMSHFDQAYLDEMGIEGLIQFAYGLVRTWAPVTLESVEVDDEGTSGRAILTARDGTLLDLDIVIDPDSGLITDVAVHESVSGTPDASPIASPAAASSIPGYTDISPVYTELKDATTATGQDAVAEFVAGDYGSLVERFAPDLQADVPADTFELASTDLTTDRVHFEYPEVGAIFDGHRQGGTISGSFFQGVAGTFSIEAESAQSLDGPTGTWSGSIVELDLAFSVTFANDDGTRSAMLDIPSQNISDQPLSNVTFEEERPIGDLIDESVLLIGEGSYGYRAAHEWGPGYLVFDVFQMSDGSLTAFLPSVQWPLPEIEQPAALSVTAPFDGAWLTYWGGASEFLNYHAVTPQQRFALDLVVWQDGSTFANDGLEVEDYFAYGQSLYAPVAGEVVSVESSLPDLPPNLAQVADPAVADEAAMLLTEQNPVGNHVVIQTGDGLFVFLAHMKPGSATVAVGDTVEVGDLLGQVGNTGNTSEPHIHLHVQTSLDLADPAAAGVPIVWDGVAIDGQPSDAAIPEQGDIVEPIDE